MRKIKGVDDGLRLQIIEEHLSGSSKGSLARKYGIKGGSYCITKWMRTFGITETGEHAVPEELMKKAKASGKPVEVLALEREVKELKAKLARERMRADAYETLVGLAEETYQIEIRKNFATKQS